jgi:hypothetical protein
MTTIPTHVGNVLALLTAAAVVTAAVLFRDLLLLAVGTMLVGAALFVARRRDKQPGPSVPVHDFSVGTPAVAMWVAGVAGVAVVAVVVTAALV